MIIVLLVIAAVVFAEIKIKKHIESLPENSFPIKKAGGKIYIEKAHNRGLFMGFLGKKQALANILSASAMLIVFIYTIARCFKGLGLLAKIGWGLILGGGIANIYDRVKHGHVTDYVRFPKIKPGKLGRVIYNIGDFCVFLGAILAAIFDR